MTFGKPDKWLQFEGTIERTSPKAILFKADTWKEESWLPRSQIQIVNQEGETATVKIKEWLCDKNGWTEDGEPDVEELNFGDPRDIDDEVPF